MENTGPDCELEVNEFHHLMGLLSMVEQNIAPAQAPKQACVTPTMAAEARIKELEEQLEMLSKKYTEVVKENDQLRHAGRKLIQTLIEMETSQ